MLMPNSDDPLNALFNPIKINRLTLANRIVMGPIAAHSPAPDGRPTEETRAFFVRRAKGGVGLIIVGGTMSTAHGWDGAPTTQYYLRLDKDEYVADLRRLTDAVHTGGAPIFAQINTSMGRMGKPGPYFIAASAVNVVIPEESLKGIIAMPGGINLPPPAAANREQIEQLERETAESALRMKEAGFDGVELGGHMSYFGASFLSSRTNHRTDEYGGSLENRARFLVNVIRRIRTGAGPDYPIGVRITANEHTPGGQGPEEYAAIAKILELAGIDYFALSDGAYESMNIGVTTQASLIRHGEAQVFRKAISRPLMLGGLHDPVQAAAALAAGHGDLVMLARPMLAEPDYALKLKEGRAQEIVRCNGDNECLRRLMMNMPIRCPLNPELGNEAHPSQRRHGFKRLLSAPIEAAVLKLSSSRFFMRQMQRLAARRAKRSQG
jgi:2,4-dienoyl-CoA reductase-like NADH-dependent reductase (Old Yellow Enzyme family)